MSKRTLEGNLAFTKKAIDGDLGFKGERGYSAYELAVLNGYEGTEQEWIDHFGLDLTGYLQTSDVVDDLTHEYITRPLSAKQGKELKSQIDTKADDATTYNKTEVNTALSLKSDITYVDDELDTKVNKSGDTLTGHLSFENNDSYWAIIKDRILDNVRYRLTVGVGANGRTCLENYVGDTLSGRLEVCSDGKLYNAKSNSYIMEKSDFAVITHTFYQTGYATENYPSGFNKDNCVVVSVMFCPSGSTYRTAAGWGAESIVAASLNNDNIRINNTLDGTATVKVVLMKI